MSLINVISPVDYQSIKGGSKIQFEINCENTLPVKSNTSIWVEYSTNAFLTDIQLLEVSDITKYVDGSWKTVANDFNGIPGKIRFNVNIPDGETVIHTRVIFSNPEEKVSSKFISLSRCILLDFNLAQPIITDVSTSKVKVTLDYEAVNPENITLQVLASNNALDGVNITWEDMTEAFNNNTFHSFSNSRMNEGYALNVRVIASKKNPNASIQIKKINIAHF